MPPRLLQMAPHDGVVVADETPELTMELDLGPLSDELLQLAHKQLGETDELRTSTLIELRELISSELPCPTTRASMSIIFHPKISIYANNSK